MQATAGPTATLTRGFQEELELLGRHIRMLQFVERHGPVGIIKLSKLLGVPKHKVRYSLRILEQAGFIAPSTQGARATDKVPQFLSQLDVMLHDVKRQVDDLVASVQKPVANTGGYN
jgi:predicted transcriptional regulator